jgi:hypothetical protein
MGGMAASPEVLARLTEFLHDARQLVRRSATWALGRFLQADVRWFTKEEGVQQVANITELSGEKV